MDHYFLIQYLKKLKNDMKKDMNATSEMVWAHCDLYFVGHWLGLTNSVRCVLPFFSTTQCQTFRIFIIFLTKNYLSFFVKSQVHKNLHSASNLIKFIYFEKTTNFCEISTLLLTTVQTVKSKVEISQNVMWPSQNIWTLT